MRRGTCWPCWPCPAVLCAGGVAASRWCEGRDITRFYQHPSSCNSYIICRRGEPPAVLSCLTGLMFDESTQTCNYDHVVKCSAQSSASRTLLDDVSATGSYSDNHRGLSVYLRHIALFKGRPVVI